MNYELAEMHDGDAVIERSQGNFEAANYWANLAYAERRGYLDTSPYGRVGLLSDEYERDWMFGGWNGVVE